MTNTVSLPQSDAFELTGGAGFNGNTAVLAPEETATFTVRPKADLPVGDYGCTLTISGSGGSEFTITVYYIVKKGQAAVTDAPQAVEGLKYNGSAQALVTAGTATGGTLLYSLEENGQYSETVPTGTNAGSYTVWYKVQGDESHNGIEPVSVAVEIAKADSAATVTANALTYNGSAQELVTAVSDTGNPVLFSEDENGDYTETVPTGTDAGDYTFWYKAQGDDNHNDTEASQLTVTIAKLPVELEWSEPTEFTYDNQSHSVTAAITNLVPGDDVTLSYSGVCTATNANNYTATVSLGGADAGNYTLDVDNARLEWSIERADISRADFVIDNFIYDGTEKKPNVAVYLNVDRLVEGIDYTLTYSDNINAGNLTATVTVTGIGNYSGTAKGYFTINPCPLTITGADLAAKTYNGSTKGVVDKVTFGGMPASQFALILGQDYIATVEHDDPNAGSDRTATVTVELKNSNYSLEKNTFVLKNQAIDKAGYKGEKTADGDIVAGSSLYSVQLPSIPDGASYGTPQYTGGSDTVTGLDIENGILHYTGGSGIVVNDKYTVTVPVDGGNNYEDYEITVSLTGTDKISLSGAPTLSTDTITYGDKLGDITLSGSMYAGATPISGTFTWDDPRVKPNAGDYEAKWNFEPEDALYSQATGFVTITVKQLPVVLDWGTTVFTYDGNTHSVSARITNIVEGDDVHPVCGGTLSAAAIGEYTATVTDLSGSFSNNYTLEGVNNTSLQWSIKPAVTLVSSVTMSRSSLRVYEGRSYSLSASVSPADATDKSLYWYSSDPGIATVDQNGKVTGKAPGVCTVYAQAKDGSGISASCTVRVLRWYPGATPITGDSSNLGLWIGVLAVSACAIAAGAVILVKKRKKK